MAEILPILQIKSKCLTIKPGWVDAATTTKGGTVVQHSVTVPVPARGNVPVTQGVGYSTV